MKQVPSGLILLHKPPGITSFDSLRDIKRLLGTGKAGHTGTLDKFAEGLLLVLTGRALKLSRWFTGCDKQYEGTICFGVETETLDPEGDTVATAPLPSRDTVEHALSQFCGEIEQAPPAYSAIHINGERASVLARRGESPEMKKRPVNIYRLELLTWEPPYARIFVHCSSGTYIRSLARDIALTSGSRAFLVGLVRTKVGGFQLKEGSRELGIGNRELLLQNGAGCQNAQPANIFSRLPIPHSPFPFIHPIDNTVFEKLGVPCIEISPWDKKNVIHGKSIEQVLQNAPHPAAETGYTAALFSENALIALIEKDNNKWKYGYVYADN